MYRSHPPSAYSMLKKMGFTGGRQKVLNTVQAMVDDVLTKRSDELILKNGRLTAESEFLMRQTSTNKY